MILKRSGKMSLQNYRKSIDKKLIEIKSIELQEKNLQSTLTEINDDIYNTEQAQNICQQVSQEIQTQAHRQIAKVVSRCLETVFDNPYEFKIVFEKSRGKTEAKLLFERDGLSTDKPKSSCGGGVVDVAAFALQLACLILKKPAARKVMILDEPFKGVHSPVYRKNVKKLLKELSRDFGVQFIIATQVPEFKIGKVIELS